MERQKKTTTVYIPVELVEKAQQLNINISKVTTVALDELLREDELEPEALALEILRSQIVEEEGKIAKLRFQLQEAEARHVKLLRKSEAQERRLAQTRRGRKVAEIMREINSVSREFDYEFDKVWPRVQQYIRELKEHDDTVDEKWFRQHLEKLQSFAQP